MVLLVPCWMAMGWVWMVGRTCTDGLLVANLSGDHEFFHDHFMHWAEMCSDILLTMFPFINAEVMTKIDSHLSDHNGIFQIGFNPFEALNTFITSISPSITNSHSLTHMISTIDKIMLNNRTQHIRVVFGEVILALLNIRHRRTVVGLQVGCHFRIALFDYPAQTMHFINTFRTSEFWVWGSPSTRHSQAEKKQNLHD